MSSMTEFMEIVSVSYTEDEIDACENWADELFWELDFDYSGKLTWNSSDNFSVSVKDDIPFDWAEEIEDWDFPDPPEFLR